MNEALLHRCNEALRAASRTSVKTTGPQALPLAEDVRASSGKFPTAPESTSNPYGMTRYSKCPEVLLNAVLRSSPFRIRTRFYPLLRSSLLKKRALCIDSIAVAMSGSGELYLTGILFRPRLIVNTQAQTSLLLLHKKETRGGG